MWCDQCNADVAAQVSADAKQIQCAVCGCGLESPAEPPNTERTAREILQRWSQNSALDPYGPRSIERGKRSTEIPEAPVVGPTSSVSVETPLNEAHGTTPSSDAPLPVTATELAPSSDSRPKSKLRFEGPQDLMNVDRESNRSRTQRPPVSRRFDESEQVIREPHFSVRARERRQNLSSAAGQWLAYVGVLALTIGTAIVVYGHFGGYTSYTPTGWLVTTVGQMLLFLGVINLVSGGMEQTSDEVSEQIEILGEHILRIEQATSHGLRGPKIPAARYAGEEVPVLQREATSSGDEPANNAG